MFYKFNDDFILRFEFFGGLLISNKTFEIYTLMHEDVIFLSCLKENFSVESAIEIVNKSLTVNYIPDFDQMVEIGVLSKTDVMKNFTVASISDMVNYYTKKVDKIKKLNYLSAPIEVSIYPSASCQLNCSFCYFKSKRGAYKKSNSAEKWKAIIDEIKMNNVLYLSILGGEPTLYSGIDDILKHVNKIKLKTTITTNGVYIKDSTFKIICDSNYITPAISLQAINEKNFDLMGVNYQKIVKTVDKFLEYGKEPRINTVVSTQTIDDIYQMVDFCVSRNIKEYYLNIYMPVNGENRYCHKFNYYKQMDDLVRKYIESHNYQDKINVAMQGCLFYSAYYNELDNPVNSDYERLIYGCEAGNTKMEIMPNGDVLPCTAFNLNDFEYENVFEQSFDNIWHNAYYLQELRNYKVKDVKCKKCKFYDFCNGGCPAYNLYKNKNIIDKGDDRCLVEI